MKHYFLFYIVATLFLTYCSQMVTNQLETPSPLQGSLSLAIDMKKAPADVAFLDGFLARTDYDTVFFDFKISGEMASAVIENLAAGEWYLQVNAYDDQERLKYSGSTFAEVVPGKVVPVFLNLTEVTGGISVTVSWGGVPENMMLVSAKNEQDEWRILLIDATTSQIFEIIDGAFPTWIGENRNHFIFRRYGNQLCDFDFSNSSVNFVNNLDYIVNFLFFSKSLNKILFDYKEGDVWNLGGFDLSGFNFHTILGTSNLEKYPVTPHGSDWIYYHTNVDGHLRIYRIKYDGSDNQLFIDSNADCGYPDFDHSGNKMVYTRHIADSVFYLVVRDMVSGEERTIDFTKVGKTMYPTFDYSGEHIYLVISQNNSLKRPIYRINLDGTGLQKVADSDKYYYFTRPRFW